MCDDDEIDNNVDVDVLTKWVAHLGGWLDQVAKMLLLHVFRTLPFAVQ